jgi:glutamate N-acetyltransferase/amino-acid N-acetyltransferase
MRTMSDWLLAPGFRFAGVHCGVRSDPERPDLALVVSDEPCTAAGVFTQNRFAAAPVRVCQERLPADDTRGFVVCAGNANACTGEQGLADARRMAALGAAVVGCSSRQFLVASTGIIGRHLPMDRVDAGITAAAARLATGPDAFRDAATAILTTDTRVKVSSRRVSTSQGDITLTGFAKGAAMIGPNLATMLGFILTDASVAPVDLQVCLREAAERTFNCISVEGHTSTNDTVLMLANGTGPRLTDGDLFSFASGVDAVCGELARAIAADAEGASHLIVVDVQGLSNDEDARRIAKAIAESALVKTAVHGADPNWGRIVSAAGYAGVPFDEEHLSLWVGEMPLYLRGSPVPFDEAAASAYLRDNREVLIRLRFPLGQGRCLFYSCDLTADYVRLNADYTT